MNVTNDFKFLSEPAGSVINPPESRKVGTPVNLTKKRSDMVNSPDHYNKGKYETIDVILDITQHLPGDEGYLTGNIIKYLSRYHFKNGQEDLEKAQNYTNRLLKLVKERSHAEHN